MTTDLITAARIAYERQQQTELENSRQLQTEYRQFAHACFVQMFGIEPDKVMTEGEDTIVISGEVALAYGPESNGLYLWFICPNCGKLVVGQQIYNLESIGKAIADGFIPHSSHNCLPTPEPDPMVTALQSIATELSRIADGIEIANGRVF